MVAVSNTHRWAALTILLALMLATGPGLAPLVTAHADDPPTTDEQDTLQKPSAVTGSTEGLTSPSTRAPEDYTECATASVSIPDNNPAGVTSEILVGSSRFIGDLNIWVDVYHTYVGDLKVTLEHVETGTSVTIIDRPGVPATLLGCSGDDIAALLEDEAATPAEDQCSAIPPAISGYLKPSNPLSAFDGRNAKGTWRLTVSDHFIGDFGILSQWCLIGTPYLGYAVDSDGSDHLWEIDLESGAHKDIGPVGYDDVEALAFSPDGTLYGVDDVLEQLITIDLVTGAGTAVGPLSLSTGVYDPGLAFDVRGSLWMVDEYTQLLYRVSPSSGHATAIGPLGQPVTGLAARGMTLYGLSGDTANNLVTIDTATGAATLVGPLEAVSVSDGGLDFDAYGGLWGITDTFPSQIFQINPNTGYATPTVATTGLGGIENLAIPPVPVAYAVDSDNTDDLWLIYLTNGVAIDVGWVGYGSVEALAFSPHGILYGVDDNLQQLITIDLDTGAGTAVGSLGVSVNDPGLAFDMGGRLWMVDDVTQLLYRVNPSSGHATAIGPLGQQVTGLAARGMTLYGLGGDGRNNLVTINTATGAATLVGLLDAVSVSDGGLDFDIYGNLWGISDTNPDTIFAINPTTGKATAIGEVFGAHGFENLAILLPSRRVFLPLVMRGS